MPALVARPPPRLRCRPNRTTAPGTLGAVVRVGADHHVLERSHLAEEPDVLERAGDAESGDLVPLEPGEGLAVESHLAVRRLEHAGDDVEDGRLAGAVRPDEPEDLAAVDVEA